MRADGPPVASAYPTARRLPATPPPPPAAMAAPWRSACFPALRRRHARCDGC